MPSGPWAKNMNYIFSSQYSHSNSWCSLSVTELLRRNVQMHIQLNKIPPTDSLRNIQLITVGRLLVFWCHEILNKKKNKQLNTVKVFVLVWFLQKFLQIWGGISECIWVNSIQMSLVFFLLRLKDPRWRLKLFFNSSTINWVMCHQRRGISYILI